MNEIVPEGNALPTDFVPHTVEAVTPLLAQDSTPEARQGFTNFLNEHKYSLEQGAPFASYLRNNIPPGPPAPLTAERIAELGDFTNTPAPIQEKLQNFIVNTGLQEDHIKELSALSKEAEAADKAAWQETQNQWKDELQKDSELNSGAGFEKNLSLIAGVIQDYGGQAGDDGYNGMQRMLNLTGAGNHPEMARFLLRIANYLPQEGRPTQASPSRGEVPLAERLFPSKG